MRFQRSPTRTKTRFRLDSWNQKEPRRFILLAKETKDARQPEINQTYFGPNANDGFSESKPAGNALLLSKSIFLIPSTWLWIISLPDLMCTRLNAGNAPMPPSGDSPHRLWVQGYCWGWKGLEASWVITEL